MSFSSEYDRNLFVARAWEDQVIWQNIPVYGLKLKSMVLIRHWGLAQNFQGRPNFPSEVVFFCSFDSLTLFQIVAVIAREEIFIGLVILSNLQIVSYFI